MDRYTLNEGSALICSGCGAENRPGRKFCSKCAAPLALGCPACGAPNEPGDLFCGECAAPLTEGVKPTPAVPVPASDPSPVAERRLVSVLFADLVGFTTLSEHRDPEEVRELLSRYFDSARELISRYGGTVEKFIGDAVMAVWGTPVAHEDDAERAVRAALELTDAIAALGTGIGAPDLRLRAGVLSGEAAVNIGADGQGMVAGDLVNTAARLQSAAAPGTVLVGPSTYNAANKAIAFDDAGSHTLKGKTLPVQAWRAVRVVAGRQGFRRTEGMEAPFVGRDEELRLIKDLFHASAREKRPRLISVTGTGGIGKSRLAWEFFKYIDGFVEVVFWHQGRCPAYGEGVTFWALGEMVKMRARIAETEDATSSRAKLAAAVNEYISDPEERRWVEPRLAHLLGLEGGYAGEREELFAAWRSFFEHISYQGPTVLLFEDLQWADPGMIDFIEHLLEWARTHPITIITLARPELMDKRPGWGAGQRNFTSLYVEPLSDESMRQLLDGLAKGLPDEVVEHVLAQAEGVPLYAVEMVRMLIDQNRLVAENGSFRLIGELRHLEVPDSLHALIAARLDGLGPEDRSLLQDASVLGKTFTLPSLSALTGNDPDQLGLRLKQLVRKELLDIEQDPRSPERGQYGFMQSLIREVAYQTLAKRDRRSRHLAAAQHFESAGDEELASVVAAHYIEAYRLSPEGPEADSLAEQARRSLMGAADRASSLGAHDLALSHLEQALSVTGDSTECVGLWEQAAHAAQLGANFEMAEKYLNKTIAWHEEQGDPSSAARATARLGSILVGTGRVEPALEKLQSSLQALPDLENDPHAVELTAELARAYFLNTQYDQAIDWAEKALAAAERLGMTPTVADLLITKGSALNFVARPRECRALLTGALALAEESLLGYQQVRALNNLATFHALISPQQGLDAARTGLMRARKLGLGEYEVFNAANGCVAAVSTGDWDWVERTAAEILRDDLPNELRVTLEIPHAVIRALRGDPRTDDRMRAIEPLVEASTDPGTEADLRWAQAWVALALGRWNEAFDRGFYQTGIAPSISNEVRYLIASRAALWSGDLRNAQNALAKIEATGSRGTWIACYCDTLAAGVAALERRKEEATMAYVRAIEVWRGLDTPFDLAMCELDFAMLVGVDNPEANAAAQEAREVFTELGAKPFLERLENVMHSPSEFEATSKESPPRPKERAESRIGVAVPDWAGLVREDRQQH